MSSNMSSNMIDEQQHDTYGKSAAALLLLTTKLLLDEALS
jgi:hypothetical protein